MSAVVFGFPGNELLTNAITDSLLAEEEIITIHRFPDEESLVRTHSNFAGKEVIVVATLDHPDNKILPLYFLCKKLKAEGAKTIMLIAPYLPYMRQDKSFHPGEVVSADYFATLLSTLVDQLVTVDPHLHRHHSLNEIFSIPCHSIHASSAISLWIKNKIDNPVLIGPDSESQQWVAQVAGEAGIPFIILNKERLSDRSVKISSPNVQKYKSFTPVIVDDIISTAHTMIETVQHLKEAELKPAVCIGVHALFVGDAYQQLLKAGVQVVVTCNTIPHISNAINLNQLIVEKLKQILSDITFRM